jgi:oligopeptide transport system substrate-binding protein
MLYKKNDQYYDKDKIVSDSLKFYLMDDANAILAAYKTGELLLGDDVPPEEISALKESEDLVIDKQFGTYMVCFNTQVAPFDNVLVRKAFSLVIDRQYIIDNIAQGAEIPANAYVAYGLSDVESTDDFRDIGGEYWDGSSEAYEANCEEARALLAEAGYPNGEGFPQVEYMFNTSAAHQAIGEALQNMWQTELGVTVTLSNQDWAVFIDTRQNGDFESARHGWLADYNDPISFLDMWVTGGGNNDSQYSNAEYDSLIQQVKNSSDREERMTLMHQAEDILMEDMPIAPIYFYTDLYVMSDSLKGFYSNSLGFKYFMYAYVEE